jgi:2-hydroxychromene-2-carboxylate isomerase
MKTITFYLDFISPYAHLAFEALPNMLHAQPVQVIYRPVLFAAMLKHLGQMGPAEIPGKREWTYRQVLWHAHGLGLNMQMPSTHPFNPLALLRLALACGQDGTVSREVCAQIFQHVWVGGADAQDPNRLAELSARLQPALPVDSQAVKQQLKDNTQAALARGVFGVPTMCVDDKVFWGFDALPMLQAYLAGDPWFERPWEAAGQVAVGVTRS